VPAQTLRPQLLEDLGGEPEAVFAHFDPEPLAAASIAQVHRATLHDGTEVVVKIRRSGIEEVIAADLRLLARLAVLAEQLPHDVSRLLRNARRGRVHVGIELAHLKRVGDQIDRAANRLTMALVIAAFIIGSSIVMTVQGGPTLFGLPAFGFLGFASAFIGGLWLLRAIWRSRRGRDLGDGD